MAITVSLASDLGQRSMAFQLVRESYLQAFELDIRNLPAVRLQHFNSDVLIALDSGSQNVLGTMSVMYPNDKGVFPCESLFGFDLTANNTLCTSKYVEIGRFATSEEGKKNRAVVISLFLGAIKRLQTLEIDGWVATVKDDVFGFLNQMSLPLNHIEQAPKLAYNDPLKAYVGDGLHLFDVPLPETAASFQRFESYVSRGLIDLGSI